MPILLSIIMICVGILSGCNEEIASLKDEEKRFLGTWKASDLDIIAFFSDRACSYFNDLSGIWEVKEGKLIIVDKDGKYVFDYSFSNNDELLTITDVESGDSLNFLRQ